MILRKSDHSSKSNGLERFRGKKPKWWLVVPLVILSGIALWYATTIAIAFKNATTKNLSGGSTLLSNNKQETPDGQINVLLIGIGGDTHPGGTLADSIMVASINPKTKSLALLSIPRDLYVNIPGYSKDKINAAHSRGESAGSQKGGGPALLKQTVSETLDIPIHYFIRVDFEGFKKIIDTVGGVTINVKTAINDPFFPDSQLKGYEPFKISAGTHKMDGATALKYSRSRETTSDLDRARRQQEVLIAMKDKVLSPEVLANPRKVTGIISILGKHLLTDFSGSEIDQFLLLAKNFNQPIIKTQVLGSTDNNLIIGGRSPNGASILMPRAGINDFSEIRIFTNAYFASPGIEIEKPTVLLENAGTSQTTLTALQKHLEWAGYSVEISQTPNTTETESVIYDATNNKKALSKAYLKETYTLPLKQRAPVTSETESTTVNDYTIIVGKDYSKLTFLSKNSDKTTKEEAQVILRESIN